MAVSMVCWSEHIVWDKQIAQGMQKMFQGKDLDENTKRWVHH